MRTPERDPAMPEALRGEMRRDEPMARHVTWRAGGRADRAYWPADIEDLRVFMRTLPENEPVCFVGLGSNLLVRDGGLRGTTVFTHSVLSHLALASMADADGEICAEAGVPSPKVARFAALHGLVGAEFLAGIPGTVGGALAMNAGCYGGETWNLVRSVTTIDRTGTLHQRTAAEYAIGYRSVSLRQAAGAPVTPGRARTDEWFVSAVFALHRGDGADSRQKVKELLAKRIASQPLGEPNAGSVFRNPVGTFAARLIEQCGLKGRSIGGAQVSPKHANFIVNTGAASAADIEALIELVQSSVKEKFGVGLEREVRIIGERA